MGETRVVDEDDIADGICPAYPAPSLKYGAPLEANR